MALRREIELLRERLGSLFKGRGLFVFGGALFVVVGIVVVSAFLLLRPKPPQVVSLDGPAFCRPCAALSRLERSMTLALARDEELSAPLAREDRARIVGEIAGWQRRCSTLLCSRVQGDEQSCKAPSASLLTELASIEALAESLTRRTGLCADGGCQSARCEQANAATVAFANLHQDLRTLVDHPSALIGDRRQISTGFIFDQLESLDDTVLAAPGFVADGRFASAEGRLLYLRDAAIEAETTSPDSAEGLLADRLEELTATIEALAKARRVGVAGGELAALWRDMAEASSRLLVEAATLRAEMRGRSGVFDAMIRPQAPGVASSQAMVCEGIVRLVQSTEQRVSKAMAQLSQCSLRADCAREEEGGGITAVTSATPSAVAGGRGMLEELAREREAAAAALRPLVFQKDVEVALTTDLQQYFTGEAIAVRPMAENNRCLNDRASRLTLTRLAANASASETVESHALDPADAAALLFAAPPDPGTYRFVLEASESRGAGEFGASAPFSVTPRSEAGCTGFTGRWQTDFGTLTIYLRGTVARGSYRQADSDRAGVLVGSVEGSTLSGRWTSELGDGGARLTLGADGRSFTGTWGQYPDRTSGAGKWDGACIGSVTSPEAPPQGPPPSDRPG